MSEQTPMVRQYLQIKGENPDAILFFRLGDFYEMFYADAEIASRELDLTLTSRNKNSPDSVPLCGIPYHAASPYIAKLISRGYKVAICEQVEDPKLAKGIVRREVTRVITPGLVVDPENLEADLNNFLLALAVPEPGGREQRYGLAYVDISTGEFRVSESQEFSTLGDELLRIDAREILLPDHGPASRTLEGLYAGRPAPLFNARGRREFAFEAAREVLDLQFGQDRIRQLVGQGYRPSLGAAGALLAYLRETQKQLPQHLHGISAYEIQEYMVLDDATLRNLEILESWMERSKKHSLLGVLDHTRTAMGARMLRRWIQYPLLNLERIQGRLDAVEELKDREIERSAIQDCLKDIKDLERLNSKISLGVAGPRDLVALKESLARIPLLRERLQDLRSRRLREMLGLIEPFEDVVVLIESALVADPPLVLREGGVFREGYHAELDDLRGIRWEGKRWIAAMEAAERERTGISSLKVRYNRVFGYYLEVTKSHLAAVPPDYERKQTLVNAERFTTPELREYESKVVGAEERAQQLEAELFVELRSRLAGESRRIRETARGLAELDVFSSLAEVAAQNHYTRPEVTQSDELVIWEGRHPVLERLNLEERFVPNDAYLDGRSNRMIILTGPNMAGKSTYMRQVALTVLMAQMGGFVPAQSARIGLVDRIFTRVGAMDNLVRGQSTFMVEMQETSLILGRATSRSLILLDEIGRGTSTFDGVSIAWAVAEYIDSHLRARTLFATHYHELAELTTQFKGIKNCHVAVKEWGENVLFLRKVMDGPASHSYGIQVARLAGVPTQVLERAGEILKNLESGQWNEVGQPRLASAGKERSAPRGQTQPLLFPVASTVEDDIRGLDLVEMTPLQALNKLKELQDRLQGRG